MFDEVSLYTDGAARGNPGPAAAGFRVLSAAGELLCEHAETLGNRTNNQAEYTALILGLEACHAYTRGQVAVGSDSKLLVEQMNSVWRVKEPEIRRLHAEAQDKAARFQDVQYHHYPRTHSEIATVDQALNRLLDLDASRSSPRAAV